MESKGRVFRHSFGKLALMSLGVVLFIFLAYFLRNANYFFVVVVIFVVSLIVFLLYITSSVKISNEGITTYRLLSSKSLKWSEIGHVSTRGQSLKLHDRDENITLSLDSQLEGYIEILDVIFKKRPDLFDVGENNIMSCGLLNNITVVGFGLLVIAASVFLYLVAEEVLETMGALILFVIGSYTIVNWFLGSRGIALESRSLLVMYLFKEISYSVDDISSVSLEKRRMNDGYVYFVRINLKSGRPFRLSTFKQGHILTYQILKRWHEKATSSQLVYSS